MGLPGLSSELSIRLDSVGRRIPAPTASVAGDGLAMHIHLQCCVLSPGTVFDTGSNIPDSLRLPGGEWFHVQQLFHEVSGPSVSFYHGEHFMSTFNPHTLRWHDTLPGHRLAGFGCPGSSRWISNTSRPLNSVFAVNRYLESRLSAARSFPSSSSQYRFTMKKKVRMPSL